MGNIRVPDQTDGGSESDCACALAAPWKTRIMEDPAWTGQPLQIPADTVWGELPGGQEYVYVTQRAQLAVLGGGAQRIYRAFTDPVTPEVAAGRFCVDPEVFYEQVSRMLTCGLLERPGEAHAMPEVHDTLTAWLHLTDACNLRCDYCFLSHRGPTMTPETGRASIDALFRSADRHGFRQVKIKYAGGEPSLKLPLIFTLHQHAVRRAAEKGLALDGVVLTNGVAWPETALAGLLEHHLRLSVSLDGVGQYHDLHRKTARGEGTFEAVRATLAAAQRLGVPVSATVTVSAGSLPGLPDLTRFLLDQAIPFSFNFYRTNAQSAGQAGLDYSTDGMVEGLKAAYRVIEANPPAYSLLGALADRARLDTPHPYACGVNQSYLVFTPGGKVARCHMLQGETVSTAWSEDSFGDLLQDPSGLRVQPMAEKPACAQCRWRYACAGGCPLIAQEGGRSPNCEIYQAILPEVLRLEAIRLVKQSEIC